MRRALLPLAIASAVWLSPAAADLHGDLGLGYQATFLSIQNGADREPDLNGFRAWAMGLATPLDLLNVYYDLGYDGGSGDATWHQAHAHLGSWLDVGRAVFAAYVAAGYQSLSQDLPPPKHAVGGLVVQEDETFSHFSLGGGARIFVQPAGPLFASAGFTVSKMLDAQVEIGTSLGDVQMDLGDEWQVALDAKLTWRLARPRGFALQGGVDWTAFRYGATDLGSDIDRPDTDVRALGLHLGASWSF
jgi:hypothetical protein